MFQLIEQTFNGGNKKNNYSGQGFDPQYNRKPYEEWSELMTMNTEK